LLILSIVGMPGSGKTTVAKIIKKEFGACIYSSGDVIRDEIKRRGLKYTKENDEKIADWFHHGRELLIVKRLIKKIKKCRSNLAVVEGLRCCRQERYLESKFKVVLISVVADSSVRYKRELERRRFKTQTNKYLRERDIREKKLGLEKLIKKAEYRILNNSTEEILRKRTVEIVNRIMKNC